MNELRTEGSPQINLSNFTIFNLVQDLTAYNTKIRDKKKTLVGLLTYLNMFDSLFSQVTT